MFVEYSTRCDAGTFGLPNCQVRLEANGNAIIARQYDVLPLGCHDSSALDFVRPSARLQCGP